MKIIHTADWHIGQRLHERSRLDEHKQFLDWLLETIQKHDIDLLLVSGDIFDTSLPSAEATNLYYRFLNDFSKQTEAYAVIIAGNHDSADHLEAPQEFLKMGRIYVVGLTDKQDTKVFDPNKCVVKIPPEPTNPRVAVAAVPYLSENKLRYISFETEVEKAERYRSRLKSFYADCLSYMPADIPKILMGHLFVYSGKETGSERKLQIGGATAIRANDFPDSADYVALGHLHRPQTIDGTDYPIRYSGSPIPLRFNEIGYEKKVYLLEFDDNGTLVQDKAIKIPTFKKLHTIEGDEDFVLWEARTQDWDGTYIQVKLKLGKPRVSINDEIRQAFSERGGEVLIVEIESPEVKQGPTIPPEDIPRPEKIFEQFHRANFNDQLPDDSLVQTFSELVQIVEETQ